MSDAAAAAGASGGVGAAWGAVSIVNATATGVGCSLAIDAPTHATWAWAGATLAWHGSTDDRLVRAVHRIAAEQVQVAGGARIDCTSPFPPSRGLKTSSAAATAMLRAALDANGTITAPDELDAWAVDASLAAGVTITGAFDDQVAVSRGGCHVTDNRARRILASPHAAGAVAVWVPDAAITKAQAAAVDPASAAAAAHEAVALARQGDIAAAMTRNGAAFLDLYAAAGLPVTRAPVDAALDAGASGAGLSGTGPAVAALFDKPRRLPHVEGGVWSWHEVVP